MSTRSGIGFPVNDIGIRFNYCHFDGYPSGVGQWLGDTIPGFFNMDLEKAEKFFFKDHPGGFSALTHTDLSLPCGFRGDYQYDLSAEERAAYYARPACYCHGARSENRDGSKDLIAEYRAVDATTMRQVSPHTFVDIEYVHLISKGGLTILGVNAWDAPALNVYKTVTLTWEQMAAMSKDEWQSLDESFYGASDE
jgi:hypothetical protein